MSQSSCRMKMPAVRESANSILTGRMPLWHWAPDNFPYHTSAKANNEFTIPLSHWHIEMIGFYIVKHTLSVLNSLKWGGERFVLRYAGIAQTIHRLHTAIDPRWHSIVFAVIDIVRIIQSELCFDVCVTPNFVCKLEWPFSNIFCKKSHENRMLFLRCFT